MTRIPAPVPADWVEHAPNLSINAACKRWGRTVKTLRRWAAETGVALKRIERATPRPMPDDFVSMHSAMSNKQLASHYRTSTAAVMRWCGEANVSRPRGQHIGPALPKTPKAKTTKPRELALRQHSSPLVARGVRDPSHAGQAADYLRRYGPVARCDADGRYNERGTHYRRNSTVLTAAEIVERAERLGFDPNAWSRIAA